jgi:hypothetical protein
VSCHLLASMEGAGHLVVSRNHISNEGREQF